MMKAEEVIVHLLQLCEAYKTILHWQITARVALGSLFLDGRCTLQVREAVSQIIANGRLYDFDNLLKKKEVKKNIAG